MNAERDPFGLTNMAQPQAPANRWPQIESALRQQKSAQRLRWLASAAAVTLAIGVFWQLPPDRGVSEYPGTEPVFSHTARPMESADAQANKDQDSLASLIKLSQQLERNLRLVRNEVAVMPEQALIYQVELEDLVAQVDEAINQNPESRELWSQRVNLLLDLNQIYRVQLRRDYSNVASL